MSERKPFGFNTTRPYEPTEEEKLLDATERRLAGGSIPIREVTQAQIFEEMIAKTEFILRGSRVKKKSRGIKGAETLRDRER